MRKKRVASGPDLAPIEARQLMELFRAEAGLAFSGDSSYVVERKLRDRLAVLGIRSFGEYVELLRSPDGAREMEEALELVTTHETYFFREEYQLRAFEREVVPRLRELTATRKRLSIWSAGCSTGEEAYTIAMIVDASHAFPGWEVRILGTDLSRRCVAAARKATYGRAAFRVVPPDYRALYFVEEEEGTRVISSIRSQCTFTQMNLLHPDRGPVVGRMDAIFCRNVLIYLDADARRAVLRTLYERLAPGGFLLLGHSESLLNVSSDFEVVHLKDDIIYRRPENESAPRLRIDKR